jgi:hypothetical protein
MKRTAKTITGLVGVVALAWVWSACSASDSTPKSSSGTGGTTSAGGSAGSGGTTTGTGGDTGTGGTTTGTGGTTTGTGGDTGTGGTTTGTGGTTTGTGGDTGTGGTTTPAGCTPVEATIPMVVDTAGFGIGSNNGVWGNWGSVAFAKTCDAPGRATGTPAGACHKLTYTYDAAVGADCTGAPIGDAGAASCNWTAVAWNAAAPKCIGPGATKVTFTAWGSGIVSFGASTGKLDSQTLTATPTQYSVDISASGYNAAALQAAFVVTFTAANTGAVVNVDDIKWVQ